MLEIDVLTKRGFAYGKDSLEILRKLPSNCTIEKVEKTDNPETWSFSIQNYTRSANSIDLHSIDSAECMHGNRIEFKSINRLPQQGWEELIDCWSCHNNEFKGMLDLEIKPRKEGVLVSNFYMLPHPDILPQCCSNKRKIFYNEVKCRFSEKQFIYKFFQEHFEVKSSLVLEVEDVKYEIKVFYACILIKNDPEEAIDAFKVGFRISDKKKDDDSFVGDYFKRQIIENLKENSLKVNILGFEASFITN